MIRGFIALFTSGVLLRPMVLLGIVIGIFFLVYFGEGKIMPIFFKPEFYGVLLFISGAYTCAFERSYYAGGIKVDWSETLLSAVGEFLLLLIAIIFSCLFFYMFYI